MPKTDTNVRPVNNSRADPRFAKPEILFFGIGAQKSGTTWLNHFLKQHPEVSLPSFKELHYWTAIERDTAPQIAILERQLQNQPDDINIKTRLEMLIRHDASHASYADVMFRQYKGQKVAGEITPDYQILSLETLRLMASLNQDTRFIFLMRDPIDRLNSGIRKRIRGVAGGDRNAPISGKIILESLQSMLADGFNGQIRRSRYEQTLRKLDELAKHVRVGVFFYEDILLRKNTDQICDFLSISRMPGDFERIANQGNPVVDPCDEAFRDLAMQSLSKTYKFMDNRFGAALPPEWRRNMT